MRMMTMTNVDDGPSLIEPRRKLDEDRQRLAEAKARRDELPPATSGKAVLMLDVLQADAEIMRAEEAEAQSMHVLQVARSMAQQRIISARRPGRVEYLRALLAAAEAGRDAAIEVRDYDEQTAGLVGLASGEHPLPQLLGIGNAMERLRREIERIQRAIDGLPPIETPVPPPPKGSTRVRLLDRVFDHYGIRYLSAGDVAELRDSDAHDLIKRKLAVEVA